MASISYSSLFYVCLITVVVWNSRNNDKFKILVSTYNLVPITNKDTIITQISKTISILIFLNGIVKINEKMKNVLTTEWVKKKWDKLSFTKQFWNVCLFLFLKHESCQNKILCCVNQFFSCFIPNFVYCRLTLTFYIN